MFCPVEMWLVEHVSTILLQRSNYSTDERCYNSWVTQVGEFGMVLLTVLRCCCAFTSILAAKNVTVGKAFLTTFDSAYIPDKGWH